MTGPDLSGTAQVEHSTRRFVTAARGCWRLGSKAQPDKLGYWSGMRSVKNSTSSDAAGGSRLLRPTTT
jgi:hypothetical protein